MLCSQSQERRCSFFVRHLGLNSLRVWAKEEQINETFAKVETKEEMLVFKAGNP